MHTCTLMGLAITTLFGKSSLPFNPLPDSHSCQQSIVSAQEPNGRLWIRGGPSFRREPSAREPVLICVLLGRTEGEAGQGSWVPELSMRSFYLLPRGYQQCGGWTLLQSSQLLHRDGRQEESQPGQHRWDLRRNKYCTVHSLFPLRSLIYISNAFPINLESCFLGAKSIKLTPNTVILVLVIWLRQDADKHL